VCHYHDFVGTSVEILRQAFCELRLSERDGGRAISECLNASSKTKKTSIDEGRFLKIRVGFIESLAASEIDNSYREVDIRNFDLEDRMGTGAGHIGVSLKLNSVFDVIFDALG